MLDCTDVFPKVLLNLGGIKIHTYGLLAAIGSFFGYLAIRRLSHRDEKIHKEELFDYVFWALIGGIIGARLFYVLFYNFDYFINHASKMIAIWEGGISVHGGIIGGALAVFIFSKIKKTDFFYITDLIVPGLALGLAFGRIGNFVNGELYGRATKFALACDFGDHIARWPVQLIDSAKNLLIFLILIYVYQKIKPKTGIVSGLFLILIGSFRFLTEFIREPDYQLGFIVSFLTMGQILALITIIFGLIIIIRQKPKA